MHGFFDFTFLESLACACCWKRWGQCRSRRTRKRMDAELRQAVRDRLGIKDDEALSKTQMTQLTELRVHDTDIEALTGLEYATNLTALDLDRNSIVP